jgi:HAD superfamily hydrolase (TIGR01509 family)
MAPELVIFDCDGVLIDSEIIASRLVAHELTQLGWQMTPDDALQRFMGMSIGDMQPLIEAKLGQALAHDWRQDMAEKLVQTMAAEAQLIPGADAMLEKITALGVNWCIASNSSQAEMVAKFTRTGLTHLTNGRMYSAASVVARGGRAKPAPDVFLAAAAAASAVPERCIVLEDSQPGVTGAVAAGMTCYGFAPHGDGAALRAAGAHAIFSTLDEIFGVLA